MKGTIESLLTEKGGCAIGVLDIIIVNWNSGDQLISCLESISTAKKISFELGRVIIVDNASTDSSLKGLNSFDLPIEVIQNNENRGFAAACNQGAKGSKAYYLLFLNPDTRLFPQSLNKAIVFMENPDHKDVGIVGVQLLDESNKVHRSCARFPSPGQFFSKMLGLDRLIPGIFRDYFMTDWNHADTRRVDHVMGAFYMVRRIVFEELNGLDERFFVYLEDLDFSCRASNLGWKSMYYAEAQVFHKGGGTSEKIKATRLFYSLRSRILYSYKHFSRGAATAVLLGTLFIEPISRTVLGMMHLSFSEISETFKGYWMLWSDLPQILRRIKRGRLNNESSHAHSL